MSFEDAEHSKWAIKRMPVVAEYLGGVKGALEDSASRGFVVVPQNTLDAIVEVGDIAQLKLVDANGRLYGEQVGILLEQAEFDAKLEAAYARLELALYVQGLLDAIAYEKAQIDEAFKMDKAYGRKLDADVDKRNYAILIGKADIESLLIDYQIREVEAERLGLDKELELIAAQVETAEERLKMIEWLNQLIIKERAILELEKQRAVILQAVIAIKEELAAIKEGMIPMYESLADAKLQQANAITNEIQWKEAIINLGFDRIDLKGAQVAADVTENKKRELLETHELDLIVNQNSLAKAKSEYELSLTKHKALISRQILAIIEAVKHADIDLQGDSRVARMEVDYNNSVAIEEQKIENIGDEITSMVNKIIEIATITKKSQRQSSTSAISVATRTSHITQKIN